MMTISCILAAAAFIGAILALMGRCPLTVPVLLLAIVEVLACLPLR